MSDFKEKALQLSPEIYQQFKSSVATGKWPDGRSLTDEQREIVMESIIIYEHAYLPEEEHVGHITDACKSKSDSSNDTQTIKVKH